MVHFQPLPGGVATVDGPILLHPNRGLHLQLLLQHFRHTSSLSYPPAASSSTHPAHMSTPAQPSFISKPLNPSCPYDVLISTHAGSFQIAAGIFNSALSSSASVLLDSGSRRHKCITVVLAAASKSLSLCYVSLPDTCSLRLLHLAHLTDENSGSPEVLCIVNFPNSLPDRMP